MTTPNWQLEEVPCDFCGEAGGEVIVAGRDRAHGLPGVVNIVRCRCGLARTSPRPTLATLAAAYPEEYGPHQAAELHERAPGGALRWALANWRGYPLGRPMAAPLRRLLAPLGAMMLAGRRSLGYGPFTGEGRLLDFGCGVGRYVAKMAAAGWRAEGIDLSPVAVTTLRAKGLTLHVGTLPGTELPPESYDVITMWQALEHVPSPRATLEAARRLLGPGGRLLVVLPRLDSLEARWFGAAWFGLELPRHFTHFTAVTLRRHMEAAGFDVGRIRSVRRPAIVRRSFAQLADETGRGVHRRLARSRLAAGVLSWIAYLAGRSGQMICEARRRG
jgi:2-polyprenyl-3-methyl-5-hydroxy-6-metoxy-1,4-benzoquinol methylase